MGRGSERSSFSKGARLDVAGVQLLSRNNQLLKKATPLTAAWDAGDVCSPAPKARYQCPKTAIACALILQNARLALSVLIPACKVLLRNTEC